jgi:hypothetical protein
MHNTAGKKRREQRPTRDANQTEVRSPGKCPGPPEPEPERLTHRRRALAMDNSVRDSSNLMCSSVRSVISTRGWLLYGMVATSPVRQRKNRPTQRPPQGPLETLGVFERRISPVPVFHTPWWTATLNTDHLQWVCGVILWADGGAFGCQASMLRLRALK